MTTIHGDVVANSALIGNNISGGVVNIYSGEPELTGAALDNSLLEACQNYFHAPQSAEQFQNTLRFTAADWLLSQEAFKSWIETTEKGPLPLLTITGKPFTGKSVMMKRAVELSRQNVSIVTASHFCGGDVSDSVQSCLRDLFGQLLGGLPIKPWEDVRRWGKDIKAGRKAGISSSTQLRDAMESIILANKDGLSTNGAGVRIFVDAIDDCSFPQSRNSSPFYGKDNQQTREVLECLGYLLTAMESANINIGVCVSRRPTPTYGGLEPSTTLIDLKPYTDVEIPILLEEKLKCLHDTKKRLRILHTLGKTGSHNFLWATIVGQQIVQLKDAENFEELERSVSNVQQSHDELYRSALRTSKSSQSNPAQLMQLLQVGLGTFRPLKTDEFRHAFAFAGKERFGHTNMAEWEKSDQGRSLDSFTNFVQLTTAGLLQAVPRRRRAVPIQATQQSMTDKGYDDYVEFLHRSTDTFLRSDTGLKELEIASRSKFEEDCHLLLLNICVKVLNHCKLKGGDDVQILDYAIEHSLNHAQKCTEIPLELPAFLTNCKHPKTNLFVSQNIEFLKKKQAKEVLLLECENTLVVLLSTMGCTALLRKHLEKCRVCQQKMSPDPGEDGTTNIYWTSVMNAAIGNHESTVFHLLNSWPPDQLDVRVRGRTLLYKACYFASLSETGNEEMLGLVKDLLRRGADPLAWCSTSYEYVLHVAIAMANAELVEVLLQSTDQEKAQSLLKAGRLKSKKGWTALHFAVTCPCGDAVEGREIVEKLLDLAPDPVELLGIENDKGQTPQDIAAEIDDEDGEEIQALLASYAID
ncbi:hypothetical protein V2A60_002258 [Cordyceps javanica]